VDSCGKATPPAAGSRNKAVNPMSSCFLTKYKDIFSEDVKPMEGPEMTIKLKE
jgi:hypothetical protein